MVRISEVSNLFPRVSFKIRKTARFNDLDHINLTTTSTTITTGYFQKFQEGLPIEEISQGEFNACLYVSMHLGTVQ